MSATAVFPIQTVEVRGESWVNLPELVCFLHFLAIEAHSADYATLAQTIENLISPDALDSGGSDGP